MGGIRWSRRPRLFPGASLQSCQQDPGYQEDNTLVLRFEAVSLGSTVAIHIHNNLHSDRAQAPVPHALPDWHVQAFSSLLTELKYCS